MIGDPVCYSVSDVIYPKLFKEFGIDGRFTKIQVRSKELESFFLSSPQYDFITVTMPYKFAVIPFCDELSVEAEMIGSVNYILIRDGRLIGCNFDGIGCLNEIEKQVCVKGKKVLVVGAGGAARAAVYEAKKRGAFVFCINRTANKAKSLAHDFGVECLLVGAGFFDVVINATSVGMDSSDEQTILPNDFNFAGCVVLDMASRFGDCLLRSQVLEDEGVYISGGKMFLNLTTYSLREFFMSKV